MSKTRDLANLADLNFDSGTLVVDKDNDRVGVGTSSPSTYGGKLNITDGSVGGETTLVVANNNANQFIRIGINADVAQIAYDNADSLAFGIATDSTTSGLTTEHMRIDASGNLLVGTTDKSTATQGVKIRADSDSIAAVADGGVSGFFGRLNSDGEMVRFRKDTDTVGSIVAEAGDLIIGTGDTGLRFIDSSNAIIPRNTNRSTADTLLDLGNTSNRFKNLYLSGGVYLGGTGSANKLTDYETGSWTVNMYDDASGGNASTTQVTGQYVKIGQQVIASFNAFNNVNTSGMTAGNAVYFTLPFAASSTGRACGTVQLDGVDFTDQTTMATTTVFDSASRATLNVSGNGRADFTIKVQDFNGTTDDVANWTLSYRTD